MITVLLVSNRDSSNWAGKLRTCLAGWGEYKSIRESDAQSFIFRPNCDLIIVDANNVEMGIQLVKEIHKANPAIPIIVTTPSPTWREGRDYFRSGASDYFRQSASDNELVSNIRRVLNLRP